MPRGLILHVVHISGTCIIASGIDVLFCRNNLGEMTRGLKPLEFFPLDQGLFLTSLYLVVWLERW